MKGTVQRMAATKYSLIPAEYREMLPAQCWRGVQFRMKYAPTDLRVDALNEAVVAHLDGKSPSLAIKRFAERERLHAQRETPVSQLLPE